MTWTPGTTTEDRIARMARQLAHDLPALAPDDEVMRRCAGMALALDLGDEDLHRLVRAVDSHLEHRPGIAI